MQSLVELRKKYKTWKTIRKEASQERCLSEAFQHKELNFYCSNRACDFSLLCDKYGSDKGGVSGSAKAYSWPPTLIVIFTADFFHTVERVSNEFSSAGWERIIRFSNHRWA